MDFNHQAFSYSAGSGNVSEEDHAIGEVMYLHYPVEADPRWAAFLNPERKGWYQCHHHVTEEFVQSSDLYQNILLPVGLRYAAAHELIWDDELCVILVVLTSIQQKPLAAEKLLFLDRLLPHLKRVAKIQRHIYKFSSDNILGYALIDKLPQPIILLNLAGSITHANTAAKTLATKTELFNIQSNKLTLPEPYKTQLQANLIHIEHLHRHQQLVSNSQDIIDDSCIKLVSESGEVLYVFAALLVSEQEIKTFGIRPLVMLTFYHPEFTQTVDTHLLYTVFNLSLAEAKVALLLLEGCLPKEIALKHHVATDTIRKQLKSIYKKTATHRQSDLVKLLLNMPRYNV